MTHSRAFPETFIKPYRYGFNGMEKVDEMKGNSNSYDFGSRMYDPRLGRFFSKDPMEKKFAFQTPYLFASNNPILFIDKNGEYSVANHFIMTYESFLKHGFSKEVAIKIAHYASVYADHPDYNEKHVGITIGQFNRNEMDKKGYGEMKSHLEYDETKYGSYDATNCSQSSDDPRMTSIHAMMSYFDPGKSSEAVTLALDGGTIEIKDGPYKGSIVVIEGANNVIKRLAGKGDKLTPEEMKELGVALHTIQDAEAHKGARWVTKDDKEKAKELHHENEHPNYRCITGQGEELAKKATDEALEIVKPTKTEECKP